MPVTIRQASFTGGELSPTMYGRNDVAKYATGLRTCSNFFISKHGAAVSRPGTKFVVEVKFPELPAPRLIPFVFSDTETYILEFGSFYMRVYANGSDTMLDQVVTVYDDADVDKLKFAQVGNVLTITHPNYDVHEVTRLSSTSWSFSTVEFNPNPFESPATPAIVAPVPTIDATHPAHEWVWQITVVEELSTGEIWESAPYTINSITNGDADPATRTDVEFDVCTHTDATTQAEARAGRFALHSDGAYHIVIDWTSSGLFSSVGLIRGFRVYRGRGERLGLVGETQTTRFRDPGIEPDWLLPPPSGRVMLDRFDVDGVLIDRDRPTAVGFYEQRMVLGGTTTSPERIVLSATNSFLDLDPRGALDSDAVDVTLGSRRREEIRSVLGLDKLLVFTSSGVWSVSGAGGPLIPTGLPEAKLQSEIGASWRDPLTVDGNVLYVRNKGCGVRDLLYNFERAGYGGVDLSFLAKHLFDGHEIVDWCYAEDPWGVVWAVRDDGKLLSLTYAREHDVWAWAQHETDGTFERICSVPEGDEDAIYVVVAREVGGVTTRYIERFASRRIDAVEEAVCLDSCVVDVNVTPQNQIAGLSHLEGREVYVLADGNVQGPYTVTSGLVSWVGTGALTICAGLPYTCRIETLDVAEAREKKKVVKSVAIEVEGSRGLFTGSGTTLWAGDSEDLVEQRGRVVADAFGASPLTTDTLTVRVRGGWAKHGRVVVEQRDPLPLTVLGISREVEIGG